jgi:hypothetical protein
MALWLQLPEDRAAELLGTCRQFPVDALVLRRYKGLVEQYGFAGGIYVQVGQLGLAAVALPSISHHLNALPDLICSLLHPLFPPPPPPPGSGARHLGICCPGPDRPGGCPRTLLPPRLCLRPPAGRGGEALPVPDGTTPDPVLACFNHGFS